jgi:hypothetical protein
MKNLKPILWTVVGMVVGAAGVPDRFLRANGLDVRARELSGWAIGVTSRRKPQAARRPV